MASTTTGLGRVLAFVYGIFAISATGRSSVQLLTKFDEAPIPYLLSGLAALIYIVATWALLTDRAGIALVAVAVELVGVLAIGADSVWRPERYDDATVWSGFGDGYGYVPLVLPIVGLIWLLRRQFGSAAPAAADR